MIRHLASAFLAGLLLVPALAAEPEAPEHPLRPMLWKVEGKGLEKPSWLFGTIHVGNGPVGTLHPAAAEALDACDALYTEVPMDAATQVGMAKHFVRTDGKKLSESVGEEIFKDLSAELKKVSPLLTPEVFQSFKTWAVAVTVPMLKLQLTGGQPLDMIVWNRASEAGKTTGALEKPEDQFGIFDDLTEEEQIILLSEALRLQREGREKGEDPVGKLVEAYVAGDPKRVQAEVEKQFAEMAEGEHAELGKKLLKRLLDDRNVIMAEGIVERFKAEPAKSHFFAVGTGHYVGKGNVGELLTKQGYTVTLVTP